MSYRIRTGGFGYLPFPSKVFICFKFGYKMVVGKKNIRGRISSYCLYLKCHFDINLSSSFSKIMSDLCVVRAEPEPWELSPSKVKTKQNQIKEIYNKHRI